VKYAPGDHAMSEKERRENPQTVSLFAEMKLRISTQCNDLQGILLSQVSQ
jgi:hypothetical protein